MPYANHEAQAEYQREWMAKRRADWLALNGPCVQCASWKDLQVDHVDPGSKVSHRVWSWSDARRSAELAKCQVLCVDCHKQKTAGDVRRRITHGSQTRSTEFVYVPVTFA